MSFEEPSLIDRSGRDHRRMISAHNTTGLISDTWEQVVRHDTARSRRNRTMLERVA